MKVAQRFIFSPLSGHQRKAWGVSARRSASFLQFERRSRDVLKAALDYLNLNFDGYNYWLEKLNSFGGDFRRAEMVKAFISSTEYRKRFGTP